MIARHSDFAVPGRAIDEKQGGCALDVLVAPFAKFGRLDEAKTVATHVSRLQPSSVPRAFTPALALPAAAATQLMGA